MKFTKLSLVAAMLIGSSAFAIENTKVSGDAKLFYHTTDATDTSVLNRGEGELFDAASSAADVAVNLNATTDLVKTDAVSVSAGAGATFLTTLGLENNLVGNVWGGAHTATGSTGANFGAGGHKVENAWWMNEAWVAATTGKTTAKLGRMELDTPLAFTEKWSIEKNTFEAAVAINTDIPDTTLVGAYIGNGNGNEGFGQNLNGGVDVPGTSGVSALGLAVGSVVNANGDFGTYGTNGAYAVGAINNSFKPLTLQAWYYDLTRLASAYWLQADLACQKVEGLMAGAQYSGVTADGANTKEDNVYALMLGFEMKDMFTAKVAYSEVNEDGTLGAAGFNTATATGASKLYTETVWGGNFGNVVAQGAKSTKVSVSTPANGIADLGLSYVGVDHVAANSDFAEIALTASKSFGPLDATVAYINTDVDNGQDAENAIQAYLTLNF
jgi:hypothetical protein